MAGKKQPSIAVKKALEQMPKTEDTQSAYQPISVKLTQNQLDKLEEIKKLGMNERFAVNLLIRYAITYANKKKCSVETLRGFPKRFGSKIINVEPTAETIMSLNDNHLSDKSKELVVLGLKVFHQRLLNIK